MIPLVETGPGDDANCRTVLEPVRGAVQQSGKSVSDAPVGKGSARESKAPIVDVKPGKGANAVDRQPQAPIFDVPPSR